MIRKIKTLEEREQKSKRNRTIGVAIVIIMGIILIFSYFGYAFFEGSQIGTDTSSAQKYNNFNFYRYGDSWKLTIDNKDYYFQYLPQETENVSVSGIYNLKDYANKTLYIANNNVAGQEVLTNIQSILLRYQDACVYNSYSTNCNNLVVKNCTDNLLVFVPDSNETSVWKSENCVYISGEMIRASDAFIYKLIGVK